MANSRRLGKKAATREELFTAVRNGNVEEIQRLLAEGAPIGGSNYQGKRAVHFAAVNPNVEVINSLYQHDSDVIKSLTLERQTPAHVAADAGNLPVLEFLFEKKADFSLKDALNENLAHKAARSGKLEVFKFLHEKGLLVGMLKERNNFNQTPRHFALHCRNIAVPNFIDSALKAKNVFVT